MGNKRFFLICLFLLILIISTHPYYIWSVNTKFVFILELLLIPLWNTKCVPRRATSFILFILFYFYAAFYQYIDVNIFGVIATLLPLIILFIDEKYWNSIYRYFFWIYSVTLIPSLIVYFGVCWLGIDLPHSTLIPFNELKDYDYFAYPFLVVSDMPLELQNIRFHAYYDEPGVVGTISGVLLVINGFKLRDWKNWPLLISGVFSFSLFFYILSFGYLFIFGSSKAKLLLAIIVIVLMAFLVVDDGPFSSLILSRLEFDNNGEWAGDNRTTDRFGIFWKKFINSDYVWFGYGKGYAEIIDSEGASYKHLIVDHGLFLFVIYIMAYVYYYFSFEISIKYKLLLVVILLAMLFQRPFIFSILYVSLLTFSAPLLQSSTKKCDKII